MNRWLLGVLLITLLFGWSCGLLNRADGDHQEDPIELKLQYVMAKGDLISMVLGINRYITERAEAPPGITPDLLPSSTMQALPQKDPWGNPYHYKRSDEDKKTFWIASAGSDGRFAGFNQKGTYADCKGQDIVFSSVRMQYGPEFKKPSP